MCVYVLCVYVSVCVGVSMCVCVCVFTCVCLRVLKCVCVCTCCDNPLPTRGIRGRVVEGLYRRRPPLAGSREHHIPHPQPDGERLAGGRKRAGGHLKRQPRTHSGVEDESPTRRRPLIHHGLRGSRRPSHSVVFLVQLFYL